MQRIAIAAALFALTSGSAFADTMYGANGNGAGAQAGNVVIIDQATGLGTLLGVGANPQGLTGLAFGAGGVLYGSTICGEGCNSNLVTINPNTGTVIATIGSIGVSIGDLAYNPTNGLLYGIGSNTNGAGGNLYTINTTTAAATFLGN